MRTWFTRVWLCWLLLWVAGGVAGWASERETPLVRAVKRVHMSVVNIHSEKTAIDKDSAFNGPGRKVNGMGTGIVVDERGYIVTNQHVIADVESLKVTLHDGSTYSARVISYDRKHDLAIIKIDPSRSLQVMPLGTSSDLMLGETVIAVGNAFGYEHTVTSGILSSLSRDVEVNETQSYKNLLQTDASINPGNSGGPLINLDGEVVGINVAIRANAQRIGFAIPIDDARRFIARLLNSSRLNDTYHGIVTHDLKSCANMKLIVDATEPNSPAANSGLKSGDIITRIAKTPVHDQADLERALLGHAAGESIECLIKREGVEMPLTLQLARNGVQQAAGNSSGVIIRGNNPDTVEEKSWQMLGLKLAKASASQLEPFRSKYRGGMKVLDVRADSPAARHGIKKGDILVGLHIWETVNNENLTYILDHPKLNTFDPLKFYVVRGQETLFGNLRIASNDRK